MYKPHPLCTLLLSCMHKPHPNENESYEVEKLSPTSPLLSATAARITAAKIVFKSFVIATYSILIQLRELEPLVYLSSSDFNTAIATLKAIYF